MNGLKSAGDSLKMGLFAIAAAIILAVFKTEVLGLVSGNQVVLTAFVICLLAKSFWGGCTWFVVLAKTWLSSGQEKTEGAPVAQEEKQD